MREDRRENEAALKIEVVLKGHEKGRTREELAKHSSEEIRSILGIAPDSIQGVRIQASGVIEITYKKAEDRSGVMMAVSKDRVEMVREKESWTGVIVHGISKNWSEGKDVPMNKLRKEIEERNGVKLATAPTWLVREENQNRSAMLQPVVIMLNRTSEKIRLTTHGVKCELATQEARLFEPSRDRARRQCTNCCGYGHLRHQCRGQASCRICAGPHTAWNHRCITRGCVGSKSRANCQHRERIVKCANCGGEHQATALNCPRRAGAFVRKTGTPLPNHQGVQ